MCPRCHTLRAPVVVPDTATATTWNLTDIEQVVDELKRQGRELRGGKA